MLRDENRDLPAPKVVIDIVNILYTRGLILHVFLLIYAAPQEAELLRLSGTHKNVQEIIFTIDRGIFHIVIGFNFCRTVF